MTQVVTYQHVRGTFPSKLRKEFEERCLRAGRDADFLNKVPAYDLSDPREAAHYTDIPGTVRASSPRAFLYLAEIRPQCFTVFFHCRLH